MSSLLNLSQNYSQHPASGFPAALSQAWAANHLQHSTQPSLPLPSTISTTNELPTLTTTPTTDDDMITFPETTTEDIVTNNQPEVVYLGDNDIRKILAMGCDIPDPTRPNGGFLSIEDIEPYMSYHKPSDIKVTVKYYQEEVLRRDILGDPSAKRIRPKQWPKKKCIAWLMEHPIHSDDNKKFILRIEKEFRQTIAAANEERAQTKASSQGRSSWPMEKSMRLLAATTEDDIKLVYASRHAADTREQLDARGSTVRQPTAEELIRDKMNDQSYNPISNINPDLHQSFAEPKDLSYAACMNRDVTTEEIKEKLADFRVKVFKCAYDYNISGNGDGNMIDEDAEWVPLESTHPDFGRWDRSKYKDDNRSDFNRNYGEIVVYAWDTWDNNDFLKTVFARLDLSQAATVDSTATTEAVSNNKKTEGKRQ